MITAQDISSVGSLVQPQKCFSRQIQWLDPSDEFDKQMRSLVPKFFSIHDQSIKIPLVILMNLCDRIFTGSYSVCFRESGYDPKWIKGAVDVSSD